MAADADVPMFELQIGGLTFREVERHDRVSIVELHGPRGSHVELALHFALSCLPDLARWRGHPYYAFLAARPDGVMVVGLCDSPDADLATMFPTFLDPEVTSTVMSADETSRMAEKMFPGWNAARVAAGQQGR